MKRKNLDSLGAKVSVSQRVRKYNSDVVSTELVVEMRQNRLGHLFYLVSYNIDGSDRYVCFDKMYSVIDFIKSNFE